MQRIFLISILLCILLVGCGKSSQFLGNWKYQDGPEYTIYQFNKDGTLLVSAHDIFSKDNSEIYEYDVDGDSISIKNENREYNFKYSINGGVLTLQDDTRLIMLQKID